MSRSTRSGGARDADVGEWVAATLTDSAEGEVAEVPTWRLREVSVRPKLRDYVSQLWDRRHFIMADSRAKAFGTTRGTVLGRVWLILNPFLDAAVYWVIFGLLLGTSRGVENFIGYLVVGVNFFPMLQKGLSAGGSIIPGSKNVMRAFSFPRASVVFSWGIRNLLDFLPTYLATLVFLVVVPQADGTHILPSLSWILSVPALLLGWLFGLGLAFLTASLTARAPDLKFIWPLIGRFWFYGSGVFFNIERIQDSHSEVYQIFTANPGHEFLWVLREILVYNRVPSPGHWAYLAAWALGMMILGFVVFWSHEESYSREH